MRTTSSDQDRRRHSWSVNLEKPAHAEDLDVLLEEAVRAVEQTAPGTYVNLVTHGDHGHPRTYLFDALSAAFGDGPISWEYIDRCGCGGYVTRVHVEDRVGGD